MKSYNKLLLLLGIGLVMASCSDMLDEKTNSQWETKYVWSVPKIAQGVLYNAYNAIEKRPDSYGSNFLDAATDNALTSNYSSAVYSLATGQMSATNNPLGIWSSVYQQFQYINLFLENGLTDETKYNLVDPEMDAEYKKRLEGEAYYLRAYWGFRMLQIYGGKTNDGEALGYPLVAHFMTEEDAMDFNSIKRNSYEECALQIMDDCDKAAEILPSEYSGDDPVWGKSEIGRATRLAALALKSKVALYAASPAYQPDAIVKLNGIGDYTVVDEASYKSKWERAAEAANVALCEPGFGEFYALQATDLAGAPNTTPSEFIMRAYHNTNGLENSHFPPYYMGRANTIPSQNLVDAFPTIDGYPISDVRSEYKENKPYENRDRRFYLNIYYHGATFGTDTEMPLDMVMGGKDSPSIDPFASRSGYYLAKFLSKKHTMLDPITGSNDKHYYPMFRKAEIFLNYAEAANEAWGPKENPKGYKYTAYQIIKDIRAKSGGITDTGYLDEMAADKFTFADLIQNERRLELAFENQRYFDMRRRLMNLTEPVRGVEITESEDGTLSFNTEKVLEQRSYNDVKFYYCPIPRNECIKNPNIKNNLGW